MKNRLAVLMAEKKIRSISKISEETGISRTTLTSIYNNREKAITYEVLKKLLNYFKCDLQNFFEI